MRICKQCEQIIPDAEDNCQRCGTYNSTNSLHEENINQNNKEE